MFQGWAGINGEWNTIEIILIKADQNYLNQQQLTPQNIIREENKKNKGGLQGISEQNELGVVQKLRKEKTGHWTSKRDVHVLYNIIDEMTIKLIVFHVYLIECNGKKIAK